ncbi:hypothetical protein EDD11_002231 [Mortierella claussenii]|nr:hypothetical protein EDD11_002231 [Mortierella claussenii]
MCGAPHDSKTAGAMSFKLTSPELLDLESYQHTLRQLISVLAGSARTSAVSSTSGRTVGAVEVPLGSGAAFVLDVSVLDLAFQEAMALQDTGSSSSSSSTLTGAMRLTSSQNFPLSFVATSPLPALHQNPASSRSSFSSLPSISRLDGTEASTTLATATAPTYHQPVVLYFLRLPLNPSLHGIQCQLSARRLCSDQVQVLDKVLRRLCDASPGAFMVGYSDGIFGVEAGVEVVYSGENSDYVARLSRPRYPQALFPTERPQHGYQYHQQHPRAYQKPYGGTHLEQSIAVTRDHGDMEMSHRVAGLVGHVEHPKATMTTGTTTEGLPDECKHPGSLLLNDSTKSVKTLKNNTIVAVEEAIAAVPKIQQNVGSTDDARALMFAAQQHDDVKDLLIRIMKVGMMGCAGSTDVSGILNYDFGLWDEAVDQLVGTHPGMDVDSLHDVLWVNYSPTSRS